MNTYKKVLLIICFLGVIVAGGLVYMFQPKAEESYFENRKLAEVPEFTKEKLFSGEFFKEYETYFTDHFPMRDYFVKVYKQYELLAPNTFVGKFHVTKDNWILLKPSDLNEEEIKQSAMKLNEFNEKVKVFGGNLEYVSLPEKMNTISFKFPSYVGVSQGAEKKAMFFELLSDDIEIFDVSEVIKEKYSQSEIDSMYYKTDHHWNANGAYAAYQEIVHHLNVDANKISANYEPVCPINNVDFFGSWNKQLSGLVDATSENLCIYLPNSETTNFIENSKIYKSLDYDENTPSSIWTKIYGIGINEHEKKLDYGRLFTSDMPVVKVVNEVNTEGMNVLILKDSYTNPMIPHLSNHFKETTIFDVRHNDDGVLMKLIEEEKFDKILVVYNDSISLNLFDFD